MKRASALRKSIAAVFLSIGLTLAALPEMTAARASGDHEHEEAAEPAPRGSSGPRTVAQSDTFELVGVARGRMLTLYLDRFENNTPITDARIEAEANGETLLAEPAPDGTYRIFADWIAKPGHYDLAFTIITAEQSDQLTATLSVPEPVVPAGALRTQLAIGGNSALNLAGAFFLGMLSMWAAIRIKSPAGQVVLARIQVVLARIRQTADGMVAGLPPRITAYRAIARHTASTLPLRVAARGRELVQQMQMMSIQLVAGQGLAFAAARGRRLYARAATSFTILSIGFVVIAIALLFVDRGVFAQGNEGAAAAAAKNPLASGGSRSVEPVDSPRRLLDGTVFVPKSSQRLLNVRTAVARTSEAASSMQIAGQVVPDPGTSGQVHSSIKGRIVPANGTWPRVGQTVKSGEVLAWIVPVVNPIDRGVIFQQLAQIDHEIGLTQERVERLTAEGSDATAQEIDSARSDLANLSRRRAAIALVVRDRDTLRAPLLAPSDGVISAAFAVSGQLVQEQQKLFEVVDPKRLWIEAYAYDITQIGEVTAADATSSIGRTYKLKFVSRGPQLQKQTIPLYFQIEAPDTSLSIGSILTVAVQTTSRRQGTILPREAVTKDAAGQTIVWHHAAAETFVPVPVRVESIDGAKVLVIAGLQPDLRIVIEWADLLNEIR